jgi:hypothetical protein
MKSRKHGVSSFIIFVKILIGPTVMCSLDVEPTDNTGQKIQDKEGIAMPTPCIISGRRPI